MPNRAPAPSLTLRSTRDQRVTYEQIRQVYVDHCTVRDSAASLETFLDTRAKHLDRFFGGMRAIDSRTTLNCSMP